MKNIYLTRNLLETIAYDYDELKNPMENLSDYDYIADETKDCIYYMDKIIFLYDINESEEK